MSEPMTAKRLAEIGARRAAVPAWERGEEHECKMQVYAGGRRLFTLQDTNLGNPGQDAIRAFVEHAPADVGALLAEVERLRAALRLALTYGLPPRDVSGARAWDSARAALEDSPPPAAQGR